MVGIHTSPHTNCSLLASIHGNQREPTSYWGLSCMQVRVWEEICPAGPTVRASQGGFGLLDVDESVIIRIMLSYDTTGDG